MILDLTGVYLLPFASMVFILCLEHTYVAKLVLSLRMDIPCPAFVSHKCTVSKCIICIEVYHFKSDTKRNVRY